MFVFVFVRFQLSVLMDTASIPEELKPYLSLYLEVLFESPVLRENGMRNYWLSLSTIWLFHSLACAVCNLGLCHHTVRSQT